MPLEILSLVFVASWVALGIRTGQRYYLVLAVLLLAGQAFRFVRLRRLGPDGIPLAAIEGSTLLFRSQSIRPTMRFPLAAIEQIRVYGQAGYRFFSFTLAGDIVKVVPTSFRREPEQAVVNFLQKALPGKVLVEPVPKTFFDRVRGDYS